jgi:MoaA/NifB/PqqE/SkfB family radical SAM enzyme
MKTERYFETKQQKDIKTIHTIKGTRDQLIKDGLYPKKFSMPLSIQFEVTSKCNLRCKHCYNKSGEPSSNDKMTNERWLFLCQEIVKDGGIFQATFSGGEPLLLGKTLWRMLDILHDDNTVFNLLTNGYLVTSQVVEKLRRYNFYWVQISIDSPIPKQHDSFRGVNGSWQKAVNASYLIANNGIPLRIASTVTRESLDMLEEYVQMAINLGASYLAIGEVLPSGNAFKDSNLFLSDSERMFFFKEVEGLAKKYRSQIDINISGSQRTQLEYAALSSIEGAIIRPNGTVRLDCSCPFVIGDVTTSNLRKIWSEKSDCWQNPKVQEFIALCDYKDGSNKGIQNYLDEDVWI